MKRITLLAIVAFVTLSTCKKDETSDDPPDNPPTALAEATIDANGGSLGADEFELVVPAGAFSGSQTLKLYKDDADKPFGEEQISPVYTVEGLPEVIDKPLIVSLKINAGGKEDYFMALGENNFINSLDTNATSYKLLPAQLETDMIRCELPVSGKSGNKKDSKKNTLSLKFSGIWGYQVLGEGTHFLIYTPPSLFLQAEELHGYLEEAYSKFTQPPFSFSYDNRTSWPVTATIKSLGSSVYGYYINSMLGDNHGYLEFNRNKMNEADEIRTTAGHEFLHLVQGLYDPRGSYSQAKIRPEWHWLNEAFAIWVEEFFSNNPNYVSTVRKHTQFDPFDGGIKGAQSEPGLHGYGMAALIKYLHDHFQADDKIYSRVYDAIKDGKKSASALGVLKNQEGEMVWDYYYEFLEMYVAGQLYSDVDVDFWKDNITSKFLVNDANDTSVIFTNSYPQLSGRLYEVEMDYPELHLGASLRFGSFPVDSYATLFKYKDAQIEKISGVPAGFEYSYLGLRQDMDNGWDFLLLVVNLELEDPYLNSTQVELYVDIKKPDLYLPPHLDFEFSYDGFFKWDYEDSATYQQGGAAIIDLIHNGSMTNYGYQAYWDTINIDDWHFKGSLSANIDFENEKLNWIYIYSYLNTGSVKDSIVFKLKDIPSLSFGENYLYFMIEGNILNHIDYIHYKREAYGSTLYQLSYDCDLSCFFSLTLDKYAYSDNHPKVVSEN